MCRNYIVAHELQFFSIIQQPVEIQWREIQSNPQTAFSERINKHACYIFPVTAVHDIIIIGFGIVHTETGMMFCGKTAILHTNSLSQRRIVVRVKMLRIKVPRQIIQILLKNPVRSADHRMAYFPAQW